MEVAVKSYSVKELMVPLSEYATVKEDATLYEAVLALEFSAKVGERKVKGVDLIQWDDEGKIVVVTAVLVGRRLGSADRRPDTRDHLDRFGIERRAGIAVGLVAGAQWGGGRQQAIIVPSQHTGFLARRNLPWLRLLFQCFTRTTTTI